MALVFRFFPQYGKSNVWYFDGMGAHFPSLYYFNLWIRSIVSHPANGIPLWSWNLGLGADIISTLAWTVVGDPTALISLLFPMKYMEYAYSALFLIRLLLVGGASVLYFRKMQVKPAAALAGGLVCMFGTFVLFLGLRHYYFVNPMIYLPLMLIGVEQVLRRQRPYFLIIIVGVAASSNFYFFYMLTILVVLYAIARYFQMTPREDSMAQPPCSGCALRWLLPAWDHAGWDYFGTHNRGRVWQFSCTRRQLDRAVLQREEYSGYLAALGSSVIASNSTMAGFSPVALMLLPMLFMRRKHHSAVKFMLVLFPLAASLPLLGSLFNGLSFPSNRFVFGWEVFS